METVHEWQCEVEVVQEWSSSVCEQLRMLAAIANTQVTFGKRVAPWAGLCFGSPFQSCTCQDPGRPANPCDLGLDIDENQRGREGEGGKESTCADHDTCLQTLQTCMYNVPPHPGPSVAT